MSTFNAYLVTPAEGPREWLTVQAQAKARARETGGTSEEVAVPATKAGLIPFLNALEARFAGAQAIEAPTEPEPLEEAPSAPPRPFLAPAPADNDDDEPRFDARVLDRQVEALGSLGERGLDDLEALQELTGVGASFSRGVHLLTIVAAGEHQLSKILRRNRSAR